MRGAETLRNPIFKPKFSMGEFGIQNSRGNTGEKNLEIGAEMC